MKTATIFPTAASGPAGFAWIWRSAADHKSSEGAFAFYFDCLTDARNNGYEVELMEPHGENAPAGPGFDLHRMGE